MKDYRLKTSERLDSQWLGIFYLISIYLSKSKASYHWC